MRMITPNRSRQMTVVVGVIVLTLPWSAVAAQTPTTWSTVEITNVRETRQLVKLGEQIFQRACFYCHGEVGEGDGLGARYMVTKPRDLTSGMFKIRSTATGSVPTDDDLFRTITVGFPEFGMPRFEYLTPQERWGLVYYIKRFAPQFGTEEPEFPSVLEPSPPVTNELLAVGKQFYEDAECWKCHGLEGRGNGPSASGLRDDWGHRSRVAAFALGPRAFKRGPSARDIVETFLTGLVGTPMPSYDGIFTNDQAWAVAYYVKSLAEKSGAQK